MCLGYYFGYLNVRFLAVCFDFGMLDIVFTGLVCLLFGLGVAVVIIFGVFGYGFDCVVTFC